MKNQFMGKEIGSPVREKGGEHMMTLARFEHTIGGENRQMAICSWFVNGVRQEAVFHVDSLEDVPPDQVIANRKSSQARQDAHFGSSGAQKFATIATPIGAIIGAIAAFWLAISTSSIAEQMKQLKPVLEKITTEQKK